MASSSEIRIRTATRADAGAIGRVHHAALHQFDDFYEAFFERKLEEVIPLNTRVALQDPKNRFLVAVLAGSDAVVGFVRYHVADATTEADSATTPTEAPETRVEAPSAAQNLFAIKGHMKELWERFGHPREDEMDACYEKAVGGRRHNYIKHIMVDPEHQRKGIGAKLLRHVVDISDAERVPTFLVASAEGYGLYRRLGFEDLGTWEIDNGYWAEVIVEHEKQLGIAGNKDLVGKFGGTKEIERYMMRWESQ